VISSKLGSISTPSNDNKIKDKQPADGQKKGIFAQISGRGLNFICFVGIFRLCKVVNHFRSLSMMDSHNLVYEKDKPDLNDPHKNDNCLITLSSVPEREQEKEDEYKMISKFFKLKNEKFLIFFFLTKK